MANQLFDFLPLSQQQFDLYSGYWKVVVNSADYSLPDCFLKGAATHVGYSYDQLSKLVATAGAQTIEARFVFSPSTDNTFGKPPFLNFGVVLYAADKCGNRLSAYHLGTATDQFLGITTFQTETISAGSQQDAVQIPHLMAATWINNWNNACNVKNGASGVVAELFITAAGTLEGYSFSLGDLTQSLFNAQVTGITFYTLLNFCLHEHYTYAAGNPYYETTYTFGLVARLYDTNGNPVANQGSSEPFYDMSYPRPPFGGPYTH